MRAKTNLRNKTISDFQRFVWILILMASGSTFLFGQSTAYVELKGQVTDVKSGKPIPEVHLSVENTNVSGLANSEGIFTLKVPSEFTNAVVRFFKINYEPKSVPTAVFDSDFSEISLVPTTLKVEELEEVELYRTADPRVIVKKVIEKPVPTSEKLIAFYREKIDRGRRNVLLGEAVVQIDLNKKTHGRKGEISIYKSRKRTDYNRLDTLAVKFRGGPYSMLYLDLTTFPESMFHDSKLEGFSFNFEEPTTINNRYIYVIHFAQIDKSQPWYYGKMYIDAKSNSLVKVDFNLNVDDRKAAAKMLVVKKPKRAKIIPLAVTYQAEYIEKDGQWYFNYGQFNMDLRVNWKGKLFNSRFAINTEMAITDRNKKSFFLEENLTKIKPTVVMADDITGFEDSEFWGANNIIHPDKNLQDVINAIQDKIKAGK